MSRCERCGSELLTNGSCLCCEPTWAPGLTTVSCPDNHWTYIPGSVVPCESGGDMAVPCETVLLVTNKQLEQAQADLTAARAENERLRTERADTVTFLREVCRDFGDNDWPDDLHLGDVIEKHLAKHLHYAKTARKEDGM